MHDGPCTTGIVEVDAAGGMHGGGIAMTGLGHDALVAGLAARYAPPQWLLLPTVADASGFRGTRTIDAIAFGLYDSRGYEVHAFEAKASRADLRRELDDPDKADLFARVADRFYIVAPGAEVARPEDLPAAWGLLYVERWGEGTRVRTVKQIPAARPRGKVGDPLPRPLVAAMLTRMQKRAEAAERTLAAIVPAEDVPTKVSEAYQRGYDAGKKDWREARDGDDAKLALAEFERASGIAVTRWNAGRVGDDFAAFQRARSALREAAGLRVGVAEQRARDAVANAEAAVEALVAFRAALLDADANLGRTG